MPVLFLGHGSPMNVIEDNAFRQEWVQLGQQFGEAGRWARPRLILCISAHWTTKDWWLTAMSKPRTIHDFGGFPQALFEQQYPAPGDPVWAAKIAQTVLQPGSGQPLHLDPEDWGLDHGSWGVLKPMFPQADIPVIQLSVDTRRSAQDHFALGQQLTHLREQGVLVVASGNTVHNLRTMQWSAGPDQAYPWTIEFDQWVAKQISAGTPQGLCEFSSLGEVARLAHPSVEHYLPLVVAAGAATSSDTPSYFNDQFQGGSIAMRSVVWS
jgi:4,5-DOPA dioxygenase extradiol